MRKILALLLCLISSIVLFMGCSSEDTSSSIKPENNTIEASITPVAYSNEVIYCCFAFV